LTVLDGHLYVFKPIPVSKTQQSISRFFAKQMPDPTQLDEMQKERGIVKSCTELERLFKVDI
jgi:hypothetical protein